MPNEQMQKWAKALAGFSVEVKPARRWPFGRHGIRAAVASRVSRSHRSWRARHVAAFTGLNAELLINGSDEQLVPDADREILPEEADVVIQVIADTNTKSQAGESRPPGAVSEGSRGIVQAASWSERAR